MRTGLFPTILLALLASACGSSPSPAQNDESRTVAPPANQVAALSEGQRNATFIRAIRDAGLPCQHVDSSAPGGTYRGMPVWNAVCQGGGRWTIVIGPDSVAQILNAEEARVVTDAQGNAAGR